MKEGDLSFEEAYKQAEKEIPEKWYEKWYAPPAVNIGVTTLAIWFRIFVSGDPFAPSLVGGAIYGLGAVIDEATTIEDFSAQDKGAQKGFPITTIERNSLLGNAETGDEYRAVWKARVALDGFGFVVSTLLPEVGAGWAARKLACGMNNHRKTMRHNRAIELATNR